MTYLGLHDGDGGLLVVLDPGFSPAPARAVTVDLGAVDVREDVTPNPAGDGTVDRTVNTGASMVSVELSVVGTADVPAQVWLEQVRVWCLPVNRCWLHVQLDGWPGPRRLAVRGAPAPRDLSPVDADVLLQWKAPDGYCEDVDVTEVNLVAVGVNVQGLAELVAAPVFTVPANPGGAPAVAVTGPVGCWWELDVYGPCTGPQLASAAGWKVSAPALTIPDGHFTRFTPNSPSGPVVCGDGDPGQDQYGQCDFAVTSWVPLTPGANSLTLTAAVFGVGFRGLLRFRNRWP